MGRWIGGQRRTDKLLDRVYAASAIDARHSVLDDFLPERGAPEPAAGGAPERATPSLFLDADGVQGDGHVGAYARVGRRQGTRAHVPAG
jgi:hypothetical protein